MSEGIFTRLSCGKSRRTLDIPKAFGIGLRSFVQARKRQRFFMTIHPKGHHRHIGKHEESYKFSTARRLIADFLAQARQFAGDEK
jgi:hypothetical protein